MAPRTAIEAVIAADTRIEAARLKLELEARLGISSDPVIVALAGRRTSHEQVRGVDPESFLPELRWPQREL
ncbi:hypothetical protein [Mycobacteroides abscessus]|uniref:hypothetical protein n=1 Tax=Mycobacteroides abscessus TaxID=36809 RepID=UPI000C25D257|nr:hypothetical protein [Mycobacteroides abscessus]